MYFLTDLFLGFSLKSIDLYMKNELLAPIQGLILHVGPFLPVLPRINLVRFIAHVVKPGEYFT